MADESHEHSASFDLHASSSSQSTAPPWLTEAIVMLRSWWSTWQLLPLVEQVRVQRGRAGTFDALDFVLILVVYAVSNAPTLKAFYKQAHPVIDTLVAVWQRRTSPGRSALCRFLKDISPANVESMRTLF